MCLSVTLVLEACGAELVDPRDLWTLDGAVELEAPSAYSPVEVWKVPGRPVKGSNMFGERALLRVREAVVNWPMTRRRLPRRYTGLVSEGSSTPCPPRGRSAILRPRKRTPAKESP